MSDWNDYCDLLLARDDLGAEEWRFAVGLARSLIGWRTSEERISDRLLMTVCGFRDRRSFVRARDGLVAKGLAHYEPGSPGRGHRSLYRLPLEPRPEPHGQEKSARRSAQYEADEKSAQKSAEKSAEKSAPERARSKQSASSSSTTTRPDEDHPTRDLASSILAAFNERALTRYTGQRWLGQIEARVREHPDLTLDDHRRIIRTNFAQPWWRNRSNGGPPTPSVLYKTASQFEQCIATHDPHADLAAGDW